MNDQADIEKELEAALSAGPVPLLLACLDEIRRLKEESHARLERAKELLWKRRQENRGLWDALRWRRFGDEMPEHRDRVRVVLNGESAEVHAVFSVGSVGRWGLKGEDFSRAAHPDDPKQLQEEQPTASESML